MTLDEPTRALVGAYLEDLVANFDPWTPEQRLLIEQIAASYEGPDGRERDPWDRLDRTLVEIQARRRMLFMALRAETVRALEEAEAVSRARSIPGSDRTQ